MMRFWLKEKNSKFVIMKNPNKKYVGAEKFGVKVTIKKELDKYSGKILFPKKHDEMNKIIKNLKKPLP